MKPSSRIHPDEFKEALISSISDSIIATDLNGNIMYWNKQAEELYKWKSREVLGKNITEVTPSTRTQKRAEEIMNSLKNGDSMVTDKNKLGSVLTNLIKNAIKFTDTGIIKIGCRQNEKFLEFSVEDSGIGIPADRKDAIFNRFEQADIADSRALEGSGLGLAIAKSYVEMLGGKIWVDSEKNRGSTFFFTIPFKPVESKTENISETGKGPGESNNNIFYLLRTMMSVFFVSQHY